MRWRVAVLVLLLALFVVATGHATTWIAPLRDLNEDDRIAMLAMEKNLVVAKIADGSAYTAAGEYWILEPQAILKGERLPRFFRADFVSFSRPHQDEILSDRGRTAILDLGYLQHRLPGGGSPRVGSWIVLWSPYTRIPFVSGPNDPVVERLRLAIRRTDLDSLTARAEAIVVGRWDRAKGSDTLTVTEWITRARPSNRLRVFLPFGGRDFRSDQLYFLGRNPAGDLEPLGMGAGAFEVRSGRIPSLERSLDDVIRQVRARRFVFESRALAQDRPSTRDHRDHP